MNERERNRRLTVNAIIIAAIIIGAGFGVYLLARRQAQPSSPQVTEEQKPAPLPSEEDQKKIEEQQKAEKQKAEEQKEKEQQQKQAAESKKMPTGTKAPMSGPEIPEPFPY